MSTIDITYADVPGFPAGTAVAKIAVSVQKPDGSFDFIDATPEQAEVEYSAATAGIYNVTVQALDSTGNALGTNVLATFTVAAPTTVTLRLPASVSVTV